MAWYVIDYKEMLNGEWRGIAVAGPFDMRKEADEWCTENSKELNAPFLSIGGDDLGDEWFTNLCLWQAGELS